MSRIVLIAAALALAGGEAAWASGTVAIIASDPHSGVDALWQEFLEENGYECTAFPSTGPEGSLAGFDVVIDMSEKWTDPTGMLAEHMRAHKGVIVWDRLPGRWGSTPTRPFRRGSARTPPLWPRISC
jgi:hypothetical protein